MCIMSPNHTKQVHFLFFNFFVHGARSPAEPISVTGELASGELAFGRNNRLSNQGDFSTPIEDNLTFSRRSRSLCFTALFGIISSAWLYLRLALPHTALVSTVLAPVAIVLATSLPVNSLFLPFSSTFCFSFKNPCLVDVISTPLWFVDTTVGRSFVFLNRKVLFSGTIQNV